MLRVLIVLLAFGFAGCSKQKGPPLAPLPPDKPGSETAGEGSQAKPDDGTGPLEVKLAAAQPTIKLLNAGRGKRAPLKFAAKAGAKQQVEIALDLTLTQAMMVDKEKKSQSRPVPTALLTGDAEVLSVGTDGAVEYKLAISKTDAREVAGAEVPLDAFKAALGSLVGLTLSGTVAANGTAGDTTVRLAKANKETAEVLQLVAMTLPAWPPLPSEPIGVGAKWQATTTNKLVGHVDVKQVTEYQLMSHANNTWTIKGTTKMSGAEQTVDGGKISKIGGKGTSEITLVDGAIYPSQKVSLEAGFTAAKADPPAGEKPESVEVQFKSTGAITAK